MFEKFTDRARRVVVHAQDEACNLNHNYIGTEHVLLGLLREDEGVAGKVLQVAGVTLDEVRREVEATIGRGSGSQPGHIPFTPRTKEVLELSLREAIQLGHTYIGTEHILLGIIREGHGVAVQVLGKLDIDAAELRRQVVEAIGGAEGEAESEGVLTPPGGGRRIRRLARPAAGLEQLRLNEALTLLLGVTRRLDGIETRLAAIEGLLRGGAAAPHAAGAGVVAAGAAGAGDPGPSEAGPSEAGPGAAGPGAAGPGAAGPGEAGPGDAGPTEDEDEAGGEAGRGASGASG